MTGVQTCALPIFLKAESVEAALAKEFYGAKADLLPKNVEALYAGEKQFI